MKMTLKVARINAGFKTQVDAAKELGVSKDTISNWEPGKTLPNLRMIPKIEKVYKLSSINQIIFLPKNNDTIVKYERSE